MAQELIHQTSTPCIEIFTATLATGADTGVTIKSRFKTIIHADAVFAEASADDLPLYCTIQSDKSTVKVASHTSSTKTIRVIVYGY